MKIAHRIAVVAAVVAMSLAASRSADAALTRVTTFGPNPGNLAMYKYVPAALPVGRPLVLVLHGCSQNAASMEAAGWNKLADVHEFAVVYPEQVSGNNPVGCFNWAGEYGDTANLVRGQGENQSIISMVDTAIAAHGSDPKKVYIVGFSAGGAFTAVMLATWPDRFAGGAIMSGLPYRCATSVSGAYSCQSPGITRTAAQWGDLVRSGSTYTGVRPRLQIWHGANDNIVKPVNEVELVKQWTNVLGTDDTADETEMIGTTVTRTAYKVGTQIVVEAYMVTGMGHATAVGADPLGTCPGTAGSYFEDRAICATLRAARFLGVVPTIGGGGTPDVAAPSVAIVSPASGDTVTGAVTIVVAANDETAMGSVALTIDGTDAGADDMAPYQFAWDATAAGPGMHTLVATARDAAGNTVTASAMVTVPGEGSGSGNGTGPGSDDEPPTDPQALPGCSLDASGGGAGAASLVFVLALVLRRRRR
ncbi:MAG: PHB depolymerase family esterase [Deltaproteobacteria bacterium]|nr:PHB depolymerase family esterase [Deltaproteobacteria bacterium]MDQ3297402.1 PHB depolymerase family esterase [Myxococcota bacterium]